MGRHSASTLPVLLAAVFAAACSPEPEPAPTIVEEPDGFGLHLSVSGGTWNDGSGAVGTALLVTLRKADGAGPDEPWTVRLSDASGQLPLQGTYQAAGPGSYAAYWWPELPLSFGRRYWLTAADGEGRALSKSFVAGGSTVRPARPLLGEAGLHWEESSERHVFRCEVEAAGSLVLSKSTLAPACSLAGLPAGPYVARVLTFSFDVSELAARTEARPVLPSSFDLSEGRVAFALSEDGMPAVQFRSAGGAVHFGTSQPGLAVWVGLGGALATTGPWEVKVTGPGIVPSSPVRFFVTPGVARTLVWFYDVRASSGAYAIEASSGSVTLTSTFYVSGGGGLQAPQEITLSGAQAATWSNAEGAKSYLVSVWDRETGELAGSRWTSQSQSPIPSEALVAGRTYDLYVAAADVDMTAASEPLGVTVAEDAYRPTSFIAP